tara:strand:- start:286 stop:504 length:219 start_codon:yes stop_codon:yes gene_type:complete
MESDRKKDYWDLKPPWCQPWTIIVSGILFLILSWISFHKIFISLILSFLIILWWSLFLILVPISYQDSSDNK